MNKLEPTEKQRIRVSKIMKALTETRVKNYFQKHYPGSDFDNMSRSQAQKIINGLGHLVPRSPISGITCSDFYFRD